MPMLGYQPRLDVRVAGEKMKAVIKVLLAVTTGILMAPEITNATQAVAAWGQIVSMRSYGSGSTDQPIYFQVEGVKVVGPSPGANCASSDWGKGDLTYWFIDPAQKALLSVMLTAYSTGRNVKVTYDNENQLYYGSCRVVYLDLQ